MNIVNTYEVDEMIIDKLKRKNICLLDIKTNEKILIDDKLNTIIKNYYEEEVGHG